MPGSNCAIYGCLTSRRHAGIGIFRIPSSNDEISKKMRDEWIRVVVRDRVVDADLRKRIKENKLSICEIHFEEKFIDRQCKFCLYSVHVGKTKGIPCSFTVQLVSMNYF